MRRLCSTATETQTQAVRDERVASLEIFCNNFYGHFMFICSNVKPLPFEAATLETNCKGRCQENERLSPTFPQQKKKHGLRAGK